MSASTLANTIRLGYKWSCEPYRVSHCSAQNEGEFHVNGVPTKLIPVRKKLIIPCKVSELKTCVKVAKLQ